MDMLSGQYNPGKISWWRGSENGFLPRVFVEQKGYVEGAQPNYDMAPWDPKSTNYWEFTSAGFADFNGDGLQDLFVGGFREFRVALNKGTKTDPKFGLRKYLLGLDGEPLSIKRSGKKEIEESRKKGQYLNLSGVSKSFINPVDWDGDGVLDLLITHSYSKKGGNPVEFFRGVQTDKGLRFEPPKPLFTAKKGQKTFPGCCPNIKVADYNNDGVLDLIFGLSIPTINGFEIDSSVAWNYNDNLKLNTPGKDVGRQIKIYSNKQIAEIKKRLDGNPSPDLRRSYIGDLEDSKYITLRHRGYIYVMLGRKNPVKAVAEKLKAKAEVKRKVIKNETIKTGGGNSPLQFEVKAPQRIKYNKEYLVEVVMNFDQGWYGYANTKGNISLGLIPTKIEYKFPEGFELVGKAVEPKPLQKRGTDVYQNMNQVFFQKFKVPYIQGKEGTGEYTIAVIVHYQVCDENGCLPPTKENIKMKAWLFW